MAKSDRHEEPLGFFQSLKAWKYFLGCYGGWLWQRLQVLRHQVDDRSKMHQRIEYLFAVII